MKSLQASRNTNRILVYAVPGAGVILMMFPSLWMLLTSSKSVGESAQIPPTTLPKYWLTDNYGRVLEALPFVKLYFNTTLPILLRVLYVVAFSSVAGFAFAKLNFKGKGLLFSLVTVQMILPSQIFIIPQYQMLAKFGLTNSLFALVFPGIVSTLGTFFLCQAYIGIPDELGGAAHLGGCTKWQTSTKVMMPLTKAFMAALAIFMVALAYADLMWPLIANTDLNKITLSAGLSILRGQFTTNYPILMADSMLATTPMVILYMVSQKQLIGGTAATGGK